MWSACGGVRVYTCGGHVMVCVGVGMGAHVECMCGVHVQKSGQALGLSSFLFC